MRLAGNFFRSAEQIQNIFGLRVKLLQNKFKICVMGLLTIAHFILFQDNTYIFMVLLIVLYLNWQLIRKYEPIQVMFV